MKECLAPIQSHNSSCAEDGLKQAGDTRGKHKISNRYFEGKVYMYFKNWVGGGGRADCIATFVCQSCKQLKTVKSFPSS